MYLLFQTFRSCRRSEHHPHDSMWTARIKLWLFKCQPEVESHPLLSRGLLFFIERSYPHVGNWTTTEISGNINPDNTGILGTLISLLLFSLSLVRAGQVLLGKTDEAWEGGAEAQLTLPLPSPPFPCAPSISTPPPHPHPSPPCPFLSSSCLPCPIESDLLLHRASISQAQCTPRSRKPSPPPPPPKCQWSMESSLCWGKEWITDAHHRIQTIQLWMEPYFPSFLFTMTLQ